MRWLKTLLATLAIVMAVPALAQHTTPKPKVLFTNVNVFDGVNDKLTMHANVLVEGNLIKQVSTRTIGSSAPITSVSAARPGTVIRWLGTFKMLQ